VHDVVPVRVVECVGDLAGEARGLVHRQRAPAGEPVAQGVAPHERHREPEDACIVAGVVERQHVEAAFTFCREVFGGDFAGPIVRFGDLPPSADAPESMGFRGVHFAAFADRFGVHWMLNCTAR
jgi:hypothetical protein